MKTLQQIVCVKLFYKQFTKVENGIKGPLLNLCPFVGKKPCCQATMGTEGGNDAFMGNPETRTLCEHGIKVNLL